MQAINSNRVESSSRAERPTSELFDKPITNIFRDSVYKALKVPIPAQDRFIGRYVLSNQEDSYIEKAVTTIKKLLRENSGLIPMFSIEPDRLREEIQTKKYLLINGKAVCFSAEPEVEDEIPNGYTDQYFCREILKEPVRCCQDHFFEKRYAQLWRERKGNVCPVGECHPWGRDLQVDQIQQKRINDFVSGQETLKSEIKECVEINNSLKAKILSLTEENEKLQKEAETQEIFLEMQDNNQLVIQQQGEGSGRIAITTSKIGIKLACTSEKAAQIAFKTAGKDGGKLIPGVSLIIGLGLGANRVWNGQFKRACAEVVSGGAGFIPGYGTAVSIAIDAAIAAVDYNESRILKEEEEKKLGEAYELLGIDPKKEITKEIVDASFRRHRKNLNPDDSNREHLGEVGNEQIKQFAQKANDAKQIIYNYHGWA